MAHMNPERREFHRHMSAATYDYGTKLSYWVLTSLLALNAGALLALLSGNFELADHVFIRTGGIWMVGVFFALLAGLSASVNALRLGMFLGNLATIEDGANIQEELENLPGRKRLSSFLRERYIPIIVGVLSAVSFFGGAGIVAADLVYTPTTNASEVEVLESNHLEDPPPAPQSSN